MPLSSNDMIIGVGMNPIIFFRTRLLLKRQSAVQIPVIARLGLTTLCVCLLFACTVKQVPIKAAVVEPVKPIASPEIGLIDVSAFFSKLSESESLKYSAEISQLYQLSQNKPIWIHQAQLKPQADLAIKILENALSDGLDPNDYNAGKLRQQWLTLTNFDVISDQQQIDFDVALSTRFIHYLYELHHGRIDPESLNFHYEPQEQWQYFQITELLYRAVQDNTLPQLVLILEPELALYHDLKKILAKYRELAASYHYSQFAFSKSLKPGDSDDQLEQLKIFLMALGDYSPATETDPLPAETENYRYNEQLISAVKAFQQRHGVDSDGVIGKKTLAALNIPLEHRVEQLELAMERLRWLPRLNTNRFILVNIPSFQLWGFDTDQQNSDYSIKMKVVVGEALDKQTPIFMADMQYLDFRPYWNVPYSIAVKELLPDMTGDPKAYLAKHNMEFVQRFNDQISAIELKQESLDLLRKGEIKLRQRPGKGNALGKVKFIFPNRKAVYLHDTPSQRLFNRSRRDFSHGCVRVEDPETLALFALQTKAGWDRKVIRKAMNSGRSQRVYLSDFIPVIIFYTTALVDSDGRVAFFDDIYGHDERLSNALIERMTVNKIQITQN